MSKTTNNLRHGIAAALIGLMLTGPAPAFDITEFEKFTAAIPDAGAHYGSAIAMDNDVLVIGAKDDDEGGSEAGAAYVYRLVDGHWAQEIKLISSDTIDFAGFGTSVAIDDDVIAIGSPRQNEFVEGEGTIVHIGAVYVFRFDGQDWIEEARLITSDFFRFDELGESVAIEGDRIISGAHQEGTACDDHKDPLVRENCRSGAAYVFEFDGESWTETAKIVPSDASTQNLFGAAIDLQGDVAVIGSWGAGNGSEGCPPDCGGDGHGAVYVYRFDGLEWIEEQIIVPPGGGEPFDYLGKNVAIDGDRIIAGAEGDAEIEVGGGAAFVYRFDAQSPDPWVLEQKLQSSDVEFVDHLGSSVALDGDTAVLGSDFNDSGEITSSGAAYIFTYDGKEWTEQVKLVPSDPEAWALFGFDVELLNGELVVCGIASDEEEGAAENAGSAYVFRGVTDCNENGTLDLIDIDEGTSPDDDNSGIPDECEVVFPCSKCPTDVDGDGTTGAFDLANLLGSWGACDETDPCFCLDGDQDGVIGAFDLAILLGAWGPCPG